MGGRLERRNGIGVKRQNEIGVLYVSVKAWLAIIYSLVIDYYY